MQRHLLIQILILWVPLSFSLFANSADVGDSDVDLVPYEKPEVEKFRTYQALRCIEKDPRSQKVFDNPKGHKATCMIKALTPALAYSFERRNMSNAEIALFLSQALEESYFFTKMTETKYHGSNGDAICDEDQSAIGQLIDAVVADTVGLVTEKVAGKNVGAGAVQITGMDMKLSTIDCLIQEYVGGVANCEWKADWTFLTNKVNKKTGEIKKVKKQVIQSTPADGKLMTQWRNWYRSNRKDRDGKPIDPNIYDILKSPEIMATPNMHLKDKNLGSLNSSILLTELSMAFWHRGCGGEMSLIANSKTKHSKIYGPKNYSSRTDELVKSATKCVKRTGIREKDIKNRTTWFNIASDCFKRQYPGTYLY